MDRNHVIGFILLFATLLIFNMVNAPSKEQLAERKRVQDSIAMVNQNAEAALIAAQEESETTADSMTIQGSDSLNIAEETVSLANDVLELDFSTKGGFITKALLKQHKNSHDVKGDFVKKDLPNVVLLDNPRNTFYTVVSSLSGQPYKTSKLMFAPSVSGNTLTMTARPEDGASIQYIYTLDDQYGLSYKIKLEGMATSSPVQLYWSNFIPKLETGEVYEQRYSSVYFKEADEDDADYCSCTSDDTEELSKTPLNWVSHANQFFNSSLIATTRPFAGGTLSTEMQDLDKSNALKRLTTDIQLDFAGTDTYEMKMFVGPNDFEMLKSYHDGLEEIIPYGSSMFGSINRWIIRPFFNFLLTFVSSKGIAILIMIFLIKMLLYPLLYKMLYSQAKMGALKPELAHLKEKYKDDAQKQQMESMKIYQEYGVSPLSGCLPMFLQMPIWIALYRFFPANIDFRQESFLWAPDLSSYDAFFQLPFEIPFMGSHLSLFTILWAISTLIYTYYNSRHMDMSANPALKYVQYLMPLMFLGFFNSYASGLTAYMFFSNLINILQTIVTKNFIFDEDKIRTQLMADKAKPKKKSSFQARLEEAMKQQQRLQEEKQKRKK